MKIVSRPVDALVIFHQGKPPTPYKFKYKAWDGTEKYVRVDKIIETEARQLGSLETIIYRCQSQIGNREIRDELKFFLKDARWELSKV